MLFQRFGAFCNLSRVKVARLDCSTIGQSETIIAADTDTESQKTIMIAITSGVVVACSLIEPGLRNAGRFEFTDKRIDLVLHHQEFELMVGKLGMVFNFDTMVTDIDNGTISFVTRRAFTRAAGTSLFLLWTDLMG